MPETAVGQPVTDYKRLTRADLALILKLHDDGRSQTFIAQQIGCHQSSVSDVLIDFKDTTTIARQKARNLSYKAVQKLDEAMDTAAEKGRSGPQEAILRLAGLLEQEGTKGGVTVIVGGQEATVQVHIGSDPTSAIQSVIQSDAQVIDMQ